jgi:hypothetical protein
LGVALAVLASAACASVPTHREASLFPGVLDLPILNGWARVDCPLNRAADVPESLPPNISVERVCIRHQGRDSSSEKSARDSYRWIIVEKAGSLRARSDERMADVWIFPAQREAVCLSLSTYRTADEHLFVELELSKEPQEVLDLSACDWSFS